MATGHWNWGRWVAALSGINQAPQELTKLKWLFFFVNATWLTFFCSTKHKCHDSVLFSLWETLPLFLPPAEKERNTASHFYAVLAKEQQCGANASFTTQESLMFGMLRGRKAEQTDRSLPSSRVSTPHWSGKGVSHQYYAWTNCNFPPQARICMEIAALLLAGLF